MATHRGKGRRTARSSRAKRPRENPEAGDRWEQPDRKHGHVYCVYTLRGADGTPLYVGVTSNLLRRLSEHGAGRRMPSGRWQPGKRWWDEVAGVTVEHLPAGTTEWEAKLYERRLIEQGTRYNLEHNPHQAAARRALAKAEERYQARRALARLAHANHDGVTREIDLNTVGGFAAGSPGVDDAIVAPPPRRSMPPPPVERSAARRVLSTPPPLPPAGTRLDRQSGENQGGESQRGEGQRGVGQGVGSERSASGAVAVADPPAVVNLQASAPDGVRPVRPSAEPSIDNQGRALAAFIVATFLILLCAVIIQLVV